MIPLCRTQGCQVALKGRLACAPGRCVLASDEPAPRRVSPKAAPSKPVAAPAPPKPAQARPPVPPTSAGPKERRVHAGTGILSSKVPPWQPKPHTPAPWHRTRCGKYVSEVAAQPEDVTCQTCLSR